MDFFSRKVKFQKFVADSKYIYYLKIHVMIHRHLQKRKLSSHNPSQNIRGHFLKTSKVGFL